MHYLTKRVALNICSYSIVSALFLLATGLLLGFEEWWKAAFTSTCAFVIGMALGELIGSWSRDLWICRGFDKSIYSPDSTTK